ncbi:DUF3630 family protein [Thalassotalea mangrovi]|uniref:DUF3630 family protein n=1 Tax=Thalassotalea mangrovi TaxID=2572245 RepID=A0A4U1B616_9GAMM|nr:DUF3630 family protein [Thalassotalea mangrovi]TKB45578.1 DUF3630 family protein [Thalassotalea mangrovi]
MRLAGTQAITLTEDNIILIRFNQEWQLDDIEHLIVLVMDKIAGAQVLEHVIGADREYLRFTCNGLYFLLQFESYSNSCWIEAEDEFSQPGISALYRQLYQSH